MTTGDVCASKSIDDLAERAIFAVDEISSLRKKLPLKSTLPAKIHTVSIPASAERVSLILSLGGEPGREPDPQDQHPVPDDG